MTSPDLSSEALRPTRVLIADDQALLRAGFRVLIESADDLQVVGEATTGQEALDRVTAGGCRRGADGHPDAGDGRAGCHPGNHRPTLG